jgi:hypothetical protein
MPKGHTQPAIKPVIEKSLFEARCHKTSKVICKSGLLLCGIPFGGRELGGIEDH